MTFQFRPAITFTDRHGLFVALGGGTNSGKTFSALRLARGIAGPTGKIAVADTEGGRTLHLKNEFKFDVTIIEPPHRPERYLQAALAAEQAGYDCLLVDSFSMEWRGIGGVLDWMDAELELAVERARAKAQQNNWQFDEFRARNANKMAASIRPKMAHKLMVAGFLGIRMPIIFSIRGEMTLDPDTKKEKFKLQCSPTFPFEVTVSFRLAQEKRGIVDLSDPAAYKMEGPHRAIFKDGEQLQEKHGEALAQWARGALPAGGPKTSATPPPRQNPPADGPYEPPLIAVPPPKSEPAAWQGYAKDYLAAARAAAKHGGPALQAFIDANADGLSRLELASDKAHSYVLQMAAEIQNEIG